MTRITEIRTIALAFYYRQHPGVSAKDMAEVFALPLGTVYRILKSEEYQKLLDTLHVHTRHLGKEKTRDPQRDEPNLFSLAKAIYTLERQNGRTPKKAVSGVILELPALKRRRVNDWVERYGWEKQL